MISEKQTTMSRRELMKYVALGGIGAMSVAGTQLFGRANSATVTSPIAPTGDPIRIGMIDPITGPYSTSSMHDIHGATVAMDMANASGGVLGRPIELLPVDDTSNPDTARKQAITLIKEERVDVLVGSFNGEAALAVSEIAEQEGKLFMVTCAYINELSGSACRPSTFIYMPTARAMSRAVAPHIVKAFGSSWFFIKHATICLWFAWREMSLPTSVLEVLVTRSRILIVLSWSSFLATRIVALPRHTRHRSAAEFRMRSRRGS